MEVDQCLVSLTNQSTLFLLLQSCVKSREFFILFWLTLCQHLEEFGIVFKIFIHQEAYVWTLHSEEIKRNCGCIYFVNRVVVFWWRDATLRLTWFFFFPAASFGLPLWTTPVPTPCATIKSAIVSERMDPDSEGVIIIHLLSVKMMVNHWCDDESWVWRSRLRTLTQEASGATSVVTIRAVKQMLLIYKFDVLWINQTQLFEDFKILSLKLRCFAVFSLHENDSEMQHEKI